MAKGRGKGLKALRSTHGTGRPRKLTLAQERQVFRWVNGKRPDQYGFDFGLWTRQIVKALLLERFEVSLCLASIGALLARLLLRPCEVLSRIAHASVLKVAHNALRALLQHRHVLVRSLA